MEALYSTSDIFALPSKRELMAISPLEAMSHGLPVLASSDGGAASYIYPVGSEQIFRTRSYRDFRKKLFRLLEDEYLRKKLSERARTYLEHTHSPAGFVDRLVELARVEADKLGRH
jgi:glycosyltransferase involved in cell wall biosynthesis